MMERAGRELLLLQASDWPFVVHSHGAVDYGIQRFAGHATAFDRATRMAEHLASGAELTDLHRSRAGGHRRPRHHLPGDRPGLVDDLNDDAGRRGKAKAA